MKWNNWKYFYLSVCFHVTIPTIYFRLLLHGWLGLLQLNDHTTHVCIKKIIKLSIQLYTVCKRVSNHLHVITHLYAHVRTTKKYTHMYTQTQAFASIYVKLVTHRQETCASFWASFYILTSYCSDIARM